MKFLFVFFTLCFFRATGQEAQPIKNLVFEGAGIRGIAYSGAIAELENRHLLGSIERVGGTSAGAITALLLSLGYQSEEITRIVNTTSFRKFNDGKFFFVGGIVRLLKYFGWYPGNAFNKWLNRMIEAKTGNRDISFEELHNRGFRDLYVTGTCLNKQRPVIFSREHYPKMKVRDAVRISVTIPFYFEPVYIDSEGKPYVRPKNKEGLDVMVDGGFVSNFPIRLFDSLKYIQSSGQNQFAFNPQTLGFRIDREEQIVNDVERKGLAEMQISDMNSYATAFYSMIIENLNRQPLTSADWQRTVSISDGTIQPRIRKLSPAEVQTLVNNGAQAMKKYFTKARD